MSPLSLSRSVRLALWLGATAFVLAAFGLSCWRWWTFQYQTFDLAFYIQALRDALHGEWDVSLLGVPLLGNHAEPIVFLFLPLFALCPHPMLLPALQVLAVATMAFTGRRIARRLGLSEAAAVALGVATLLAPASGYLAAHEFHPEALSAPLLLLLYEARQAGRPRLYLTWFLLTLACKENIALLLVGWCVVHGWLDRARGRAWLWRWDIAPGLAAALWLGLYATWLSPHLNGGRVDYGNLYSELGDSSRDALVKAFTEPHRIRDALWRGVSQGDLVWGMLASSAGLLLQHLLSWRASEWVIDFHYAAPLVPLFWLAAAECAARWRRREVLAFAPAVACLILQPLIGPIREIAPEFLNAHSLIWNRRWKARLVEKIAAHPSLSVVCGMPYLSHLAARPQLHSLHLVLKGLRTLSLRPYTPDYVPDLVLLDFADATTFSKVSGYYHPPGGIVGYPLDSSDELLNRFLGQRQWAALSMNAVTVLRALPTPAAESQLAPPPGGATLSPGMQLRACGLQKPAGPHGPLALTMEWKWTEPRKIVPWVKLRFMAGSTGFAIILGMCDPAATNGLSREQREILIPPWAPNGRYQVTAEFYDQIRLLWGKGEISPKFGEVPLGEVELH
jgi:hypothetical protein